jgi:hypothetical protein
MKAIGTISQGVAAYDAGRYTRLAMKVNARNARSDGVAERDRIRFDSRQAIGRQLVQQGSSGFQMGTGTALDELRESMIARELDLMTSRRHAELTAQGFKQQGDLAFEQGKSAMIGGYISGAASLVEDVAKVVTGGGA